MDLERCAKCGADWIAGHERCMKCGFTAIGAGLKNAPKKKKRRAGRYSEPGSWRGFLLTVLVGAIAFGSYKYQPWQDDWEMVKAWFGKGRRHSIVGEWEVLRTLHVKKDVPPVLSQPAIQSGVLKFSEKGKVQMEFGGELGKAEVSGNYTQAGQLLAVKGLQTSTESLSVPSGLNMRLSWSGPDNIIATAGSEAIYLRRRNPEHPLLRMVKLGLKSETTKNGGMRGVIATMRDQANATQ